MGKHFVAETMRQLERQAKPAQDAEPSEAERAAEMNELWERLQAEAAGVGIGEWHD